MKSPGFSQLTGFSLRFWPPSLSSNSHVDLVLHTCRFQTQSTPSISDTLAVIVLKRWHELPQAALRTPSLGAGLAAAPASSPDTPTMFRGISSDVKDSSHSPVPADQRTLQGAGEGRRYDGLAVDASLSWPLAVPQPADGTAVQPAPEAAAHEAGAACGHRLTSRR